VSEPDAAYVSRIVSTSSIMLTLTLNGRVTEVADAHTIAELVARLGLTGKRIAVEKNGEIVPRSRYADTPVARGDRLEIVGAVGGG
jgi:sulfur carrier protein